jgi:hypothetical protein
VPRVEAAISLCSIVALHSPYGVRSTSPVVRTLAPIHLVPERHALIREARPGPAQHEVVELLEAPALEGVADDRDVCGVRAVSPRKRASEKSTFWCESSVRGRKEAGSMREAQVGLAFGCCGVGGGGGARCI